MKPLMQLGAITDKIVMKIKADFLVMQGLRGRFINLRESTKRRDQIEVQLDNLCVRNYYERFEAIKGEFDEAKHRGLNSGELGLWKSWLGILKQERKICQDRNIYLHIIEDDCILNKELYKLLHNSSKVSDKFDIIATDMYVNPSIYLTLKERCRNNKSNQIVEIIKLYTGCTSSMIIHSSKIEKIYAILTEEFEKMEKLIPIDNYLVRSNKKKELNIGTTVPFLNSVREESIGASTIQIAKENDMAICLTQELCSILRRQLSIRTCEQKEIESLIKIYPELVRLKEGSRIEESNIEIIIEAMLKHSELNGILKYKYRENLIDEIGNPQKKRIGD